jgi:Spy/CpxP family protein refolding chaperone
MDHEGDHQGAVTLLIAMSLETLGLSPEQHAAVEKIRTDLYARMEPTRAAEHNLVATLAEGVAVSSLEATKLDAAVAQVTMAAAAVQDASADAMDALHGVLTPVQRASLVDAVESQWAMWQRTNADGTGPMYPNDGHLAMLAMGLDLTAEQVDTIRASLGEASVAVPELDPKEVATHVRAFGVAFRSEKLEARGFITARSKNARVAALGAEHMTHFVEAVSPVLTPDQRAAFAQKLREHAAREPNTRRTSRTALREAPTDRTVGGRP